MNIWQICISNAEIFEVYWGKLPVITAHTYNFSKCAHCSDWTAHKISLFCSLGHLDNEICEVYNDICLTPLKHKKSKLVKSSHTMLQYYNITILQYYNITILQYYNNTKLPYNNIIILNVTVFQYYSITEW